MAAYTCSTTKSTNSKSAFKKSQRKLSKLLAQAKKRAEIKATGNPTKYIMVGNAGLMTETSIDDIIAVFSFYGPLENVHMLQGESFCFVEYKAESDALTALETVHGKPLSNFNKPLYLTFVEDVPECFRKDFHADRLPPGLAIIENAVSEAEEATLLSDIEWHDQGDQNLKYRKVQHYGYKFCYENNNVDREHPLSEKIPPFCMAILKRSLKDNHISYLPDQLTINQYAPGQGIPPHIDTHSAFEDEILSLSLGTTVVMEFRNSNSGQRIPVTLPRRSLLIMAGESRYLWSHGITPRKTDVISTADGLTISHRGTRTSYTFRKIRHTPCSCQFKELCDSQKSEPATANSPALSKEPVECESSAKLLEDLHVHKVYEEIADHFCETRHKPWPRISAFLESLPIGTLLLDIGCGNGKYLSSTISSTFKVGCEYSRNLLSICQKRGFQTFCCDAMSLPVKSECFDVCISIAVIHHFSTVNRRIKAIKEMARILKPSGKALIYVWSLEQRAENQSSNYIKKSRAILDPNLTACISHPDLDDSDNKSATTEFNLPIHVNRTYFEHQDVLVPWNLRTHNDRFSSDSERHSQCISESKQVYHRYYHVFHEGELEDLCCRVPEFKVADRFYDCGNWCVILEKNQC